MSTSLDTEGSILGPLTSYQSDLIVIKGLGYTMLITTKEEWQLYLPMVEVLGRNQQSFHDQVIAEQIGVGCRFPSLELGVQTSVWGGSVQTRMSYAGPGILSA